MKRTQGFTLIELLVVITIIGILAVTSITLFTNSQEKAKDAARQADLSSMESAVNLYYANASLYPGAATVADFAKLTKADLTTAIVGNYINKLSIDPSSPTNKYDYAVEYETAGDPTKPVKYWEFSVELESSTNDAKEDADGGNNGDQLEAGKGTLSVGGATATNDYVEDGSGVNGAIQTSWSS
ncbi:type II secretion system protein [Candidatus Peregrinibacteria bacterium]|nr:type II secretion system protein [Candidatus Peregrinibacteria bacterium]